MDKKSIIKRIECICKQHEWQYELKPTGKSWSADIIISYSNYKVAFKIGKRFYSQKEEYETMRKERICVCWLVLGSDKIILYGKYPTFPVYEEAGNEQVQVNVVKSLPIDDFVTLLVRGKIVKETRIKAKTIEIHFVANECYHCGELYFVYYLRKALSNDGISYYSYKDSHNYYEKEDYMEEDNVADYALNEKIINAVHRYLTENPIHNVNVGKIKEHFSNTTQSSYKSFECPKCNYFLGDFYYSELIFDYIYESNDPNIITIDVSNDDIYFPIIYWIVKE